MLVGAGVLFYAKGRDNGPKFKTMPITRGNLRSMVTATGTLNAVTTVLVGTQVSGMIKKLHADFNSPVKKGQIVAEIDPAIFEAAVAQREGEPGPGTGDGREGQGNAGRRHADQGPGQEALCQRLHRRGRPHRRGDDARRRRGAARRRHAITQSRCEAALRTAEINLNYTKIVCPVDGVVVSRNVDVGQTVAASFTTPTLFTIAQDLTKMQIDTNVDEADIGRVKVGAGCGIHRRCLSRPHLPRDGEADTDRPHHRAERRDLRRGHHGGQHRSEADARHDRERLHRRRRARKGSSKCRTPPCGSGPPRRTGSTSGRRRPKRPQGVRRAVRRQEEARRLRAARREAARPAREATASGYCRTASLKRVPVTIGISDGTFSEVTSGDLREGQEVIVESSSRPARRRPSATGQSSMPRFIR